MASLVTTTPGWVRGPRLGPHSIQRYGTAVHQAHGKTCVVRGGETHVRRKTHVPNLFDA